MILTDMKALMQSGDERAGCGERGISTGGT